jgi:signal transduction histidine kinase/ActR/RegA family two-component response regulator
MMTTDKINDPAKPHTNDGISDIETTRQADISNPHIQTSHARTGKHRRHNDHPAAITESVVLCRENVATARENAALMREDAAHLREESISSRELDLKVAETLQAATDSHLLVLKQVNERLVISTIEAQTLAEQLQKTQAQLEQAKAIAEAANLAKSSFLSSMSHELRTPLNAILGFSQLIEAGTPPPTPTQAARLQQISKAGWYLLELINEILDLAVIESGKIALSREPVLLLDVIHECHAMIEALAKNHGVQLSYLPFDLGWVVNADRVRLKQVLINLLTNAIKYNRAHGTVEVSCSASTPDRIRISIRDSGEGLSAEKLAQLFQPFNRLGQEVGAEEGTGIGLVVCKRLTELMGGTIGMESTVGTGSVFWIELNGDRMPQLAEVLPDIPVAHDSNTVARFTLLYVEDNPANLMLVEQIIERHPHIRMLSAIDGNQGIALALAHLPDVILMDINLPGISGIQTLEILHKNPVTAHIPVIALSANAMQRDIENGMQSGFFRYLTKPVKIDEIMQALNEALKLPAADSDN